MSGPTDPAPERPGLRSLAPDEFREVIGHFASGVTVVTTQHEARPFGTTASAVSSLSLEPPMVLICMNRTSETGRAIAASGRFAVNILGEDQPDAAMRFARKGAEKFAGVAVAPGLGDAPLLADALAILECRVVEETIGGTHSVFLAEVDRATARRGTPLAYFRGQFGRFEPVAGDEPPAAPLEREAELARCRRLVGALASDRPGGAPDSDRGAVVTELLDRLIALAGDPALARGYREVDASAVLADRSSAPPR